MKASYSSILATFISVFLLYHISLNLQSSLTAFHHKLLAFLHKKQSLVWLPFLAFAVFFAVGICILGWKEFIEMFGYDYLSHISAILSLPS